MLKVRYNIPPPTDRIRFDSPTGELRETFRTMKRRGHFDWSGTDNRFLYRSAQLAGVKITARKIDGGGWRVWRIK